MLGYMCPFRENMWGCCRIWTWKRWWVCVCVFDYLSISLKLLHIAYITIMIYYEYLYTTGRPQDMFSSICAARSNWVGAGQWISMLNIQMTCLGWWCSKDPSNEDSGGSELWVVIYLVFCLQVNPPNLHNRPGSVTLERIHLIKR